MTPEEQRIAIAKACESQCCRMNEEGEWMLKGAWETRFEPLTDLNAMAAVEKGLYGPFVLDYVSNLFKKFDQGEGWDESSMRQVFFPFLCATAAQRAEAFLKTIGKWKE